MKSLAKLALGGWILLGLSACGPGVSFGGSGGNGGNSGQNPVNQLKLVYGNYGSGVAGVALANNPIIFPQPLPFAGAAYTDYTGPEITAIAAPTAGVSILKYSVPVSSNDVEFFCFDTSQVNLRPYTRINVAGTLAGGVDALQNHAPTAGSYSVAVWDGPASASYDVVQYGSPDWNSSSFNFVVSANPATASSSVTGSGAYAKVTSCIFVTIFVPSVGGDYAATVINSLAVYLLP